MKDYILFMYSDALSAEQASDAIRWNNYFTALYASGSFEGGSSIGPGTRFRLNSIDQRSDQSMNGFIRVRAVNLTAAKQFLVGNPVYEAGGTVEIRELPQDQ